MAYLMTPTKNRFPHKVLTTNQKSKLHISSLIDIEEFGFWLLARDFLLKYCNLECPTQTLLSLRGKTLRRRRVGEKST
jgi:hypothetical protein